MNSKGFTLIELLGVIVLLTIILSIAIGGYTKYLSNSRKKSFEIAEKNFRNATKSAYIDCASNSPNKDFCRNHAELGVGHLSDKVSLKELVYDDYIDIIKNPYNTEEACDIQNSYVSVTVDATTLQNYNPDILYKVCLICGDKKSKDCLE